MSISMERFALKGNFATYEPYPKTSATEAIFRLQCHYCGYEPRDAVVAPQMCPKCHSRAWERYAKPRSILQNAKRYVA